MAAKKKSKKKPAKKATRNRSTSPKKSPKKNAAKKSASKKRAAPKKSAKKKAAPKKAAKKKATRRGSGNPAFPSARARVTSGGESGDLQGLSNRERADSESVDELLEEGNALEAGVVSGVEEADDADEQEVRTREVPEDDVPEEYLDQD
ncbi:MAG: hypothetical protein ACJ71N_06435 [Terriglobales bacterium]|jgi:hypothetical protein